MGLGFFRKDKKGFELTLGSVAGLIFSVIFLLVIYNVFGETIATFFGVESQDKDTIDSWNSLIKETHTMNIHLTNFEKTVPQGTELCVNSVFPYTLGNEYAILAFDRGIGKMEDGCNNYERPRPTSCDKDACVCLYNTDLWDDRPSDEDEAMNGLVDKRCENLDDFDEINSIAGEDEGEASNLGGAKNANVGVSGWSGSYEYLMTYGGDEEYCGFFNTAEKWGVQAFYVEIYKDVSGNKSLFLAKYDVDDPNVGNDIKKRRERCNQILPTP